MKKKTHGFGMKSVSRYLPIFIILLSLSIIIGSTFAYFTDKKDDTSELTFSKVELSGETTTGINGSLHDVIPGTPLVDGSLKFSKSIDSEPIYVRAKISFSLLAEYKDDEDMNEMLDLLRSATDFNIVSDNQHGAVWSVKDGNYFYLVSNADNTKLMRVDTIDTYVLSNEVVVPRDLKNLPNNAQYMKSINFHVAFESIQADNVSSVLSETKEIFNAIFPEVEAEKLQDENKLNFIRNDGSVGFVLEVDENGIVSEPEVSVDIIGNDTYFTGNWFADSAYSQEFNFETPIEGEVNIYPEVYAASEGLTYMSNWNGYSVSGTNVVDEVIYIPNYHDGERVNTINHNAFYNKSFITNIYMSDFITTIYSYAFYNCTNYTDIVLPKNVSLVYSSAFYNTGFYNVEDNWENEFLLVPIGSNSSDAPVCLATSVLDYDDTGLFPTPMIDNKNGTFSETSYTLNFGNFSREVALIGNASRTGSYDNIIIPETIKNIADSSFAWWDYKFVVRIESASVLKDLKYASSQGGLLKRTLFILIEKSIYDSGEIGSYVTGGTFTLKDGLYDGTGNTWSSGKQYYKLCDEEFLSECDSWGFDDPFGDDWL